MFNFCLNQICASNYFIICVLTIHICFNWLYFFVFKTIQSNQGHNSGLTHDSITYQKLCHEHFGNHIPFCSKFH